MSLTELTIKKVGDEEGWESKPYICPTGYQSIGYGFNLEAIEMPREVGDLWLEMILKQIDQKLDQLWFYSVLDNPRKTVLIDMCYQMGYSGLMDFKKMWASIAEKNYNEAAMHLLDSKYARQAPNRANRNAEIMRSGNL